MFDDKNKTRLIEDRQKYFTTKNTLKKFVKNILRQKNTLKKITKNIWR